MNCCRVCGRALRPEPLIAFDGMPAKAQQLPTKSELPQDAGIRLEVSQCSGCGLVQLTNEPVSYFREVIRAAAFSPEMREFRRRQFAEWVKTYHLAGKKVLEIGCGRGEYLELMRETGADASGVEYGAASVEFARMQGLPVSRCYPGDGDGPLPGGSFDGFFILNFLEHLPDLTAVLRRLAANLVPGGVGLIEVPNFDMMIREKMFAEFTSDHLFYFTAESLRNTLNYCGFEVVSCREIWYDYIISAEVRRREFYDLSGFAELQRQLEAELKGFIARHGKVAVWGAGHQALAALALGKTGGKISYIVDSAPFKQGRFSPATRIPIVSPDHLRSDPPAAVIVMAAGYSDEVVSILEKKFHFAGPVAVLRDNRLDIRNSSWS